MENFLVKLKLIYLPFLAVSVGFIVFYTFLNWLLIIKFGIVLNEEVINFWLPLALPWIPILLVIRVKVRFLSLKSSRNNLPFLYQLVAWAVLSAPTVIAQEYIATATGELTRLENISGIVKQPLTKYYSIHTHTIDKNHSVVYRKAEITGKNNETLTFHIYVASPVLGDTANLVRNRQTQPLAWLGTEYSKSVGSRISDAEKDTVIKQFTTETAAKFEAQNFDTFVYLDKIGHNDHHKGYLSAIKTSPGFNGHEPIIFESKNEPFEARNGGKLGWIFKAFGIGAGVWLIMILIPRLNKSAVIKASENTASAEWRSFLKSLSMTNLLGRTPVTSIIIAINILVFVIMVFAGLGFMTFDAKDLYDWGADYRPAVLDGQWWRLFTSTFLHGGIMHLALNMYGLLFVGIFLEPLAGRAKYITAYIVCGLFASITSVWWHPATVGVGASGAIFGLYGVYLALLTTNRVDGAIKKALLINTLIFVGFNLFAGLAGGVDNAAHIGGLITGITIGYIYYFFLEPAKVPKPRKPRHKAIVEDGAEA